MKLSDTATIVLLAGLVDGLGYGVMPPDPSWGNILVNMQTYVQTGWWVTATAGVCLWALVFLLNAARQAPGAEPLRLL